MRWNSDVLERLWIHGVQPMARTPPELVRNYVRDLYKYEIRQLRERYLRQEFPKAEYWDGPVEDQTEETANPRILEFLQKLSQPDRASPVQTDLPS